MRVCVVGPGAIGAHLAVPLAESGVQVSLLGRGAHLQAIIANGLTLIHGGRERTVRLPASASAAELGPQDFVILAVKTYQAPAAAGLLAPLLGPDTAVMTAMNGIPWWYCHRIGGELEGRTLASVDPDAELWRGIGPARAIGCVPFSAARIVAPGIVRHGQGELYPLGEPSGELTPRLERIRSAFLRAGFEAPASPRIRDHVWTKLWGNLAINPISALTLGTMRRIATEPGTREVARRMMREAELVASRLGARMTMTLEARLDNAAGVGDHKTSMLQDLERGAPLELDGVVGVVVELARLVGAPVPTIETVLALARARAISKSGNG
jgi:2-dehydropantoate 2-reductase